MALTSYCWSAIFPTARIDSLAIGTSTFPAYSHSSVTGGKTFSIDILEKNDGN